MNATTNAMDGILPYGYYPPRDICNCLLGFIQGLCLGLCRVSRVKGGKGGNP
jgi:hypothetical protein